MQGPQNGTQRCRRLAGPVREVGGPPHRCVLIIHGLAAQCVDMDLQPDGTQLEGWNFIQEKVLSHDEDMIADHSDDIDTLLVFVSSELLVVTLNVRELTVVRCRPASSPPSSQPSLSSPSSFSSQTTRKRRPKYSPSSHSGSPAIPPTYYPSSTRPPTRCPPPPRSRRRRA